MDNHINSRISGNFSPKTVSKRQDSPYSASVGETFLDIANRSIEGAEMPFRNLGSIFRAIAREQLNVNFHDALPFGAEFVSDSTLSNF